MTRHVVVVGGGVIGLTAALRCAERGLRVTLLERDGPGRAGCSFGNAGMVVPSHFVPLAAPGMVGLALRCLASPTSPFYLAPRLSLDLVRWGLGFWRAATATHVRRSAPLLRNLALAGRAAYAQHESADAIGFSQRGTLILCRTRHGLDEERAVARHAAELGLAADVLGPADVGALEPDAPPDVVGAVRYPDDGNLDPARLVSSLTRAAAAAGVAIRVGTAATGWRRGAGGVAAVRLASGEDIDGDDFVLAAGSWSMDLVRPLGLRLPIEAGTGYSLTLEPAPIALRHAAILAEARVSVSPMPGKLRIGGTMALAGLNARIMPGRVRGIVAAAQQYYPALGDPMFEHVQPWQGLRPCSPDGLPFVGRTRAASNLVIAAGHAMMGVTLAPATAAIVAALLCGETPPFDVGPLSPDRFH